MGAVVADAIIVVGVLIVTVHIVDGEGDLLADIVSTIGSAAQVLNKCVNVQILQDACDLRSVQQIQALHISFEGHALGLCVLAQGVQVCLIVEALVVGVQTGVDDSDPGACTGVAAGPCIVGADHGGGSGHHGICLGRLVFQRLILILQENILDALHGGDLLHLAVEHIGGDDVCSQGHVPHDIQAFAAQDILLDPGDHRSMLVFQAGTVGHGGGVVSHIHGGVQFQSCLFVQDNGNTDHIGVSVRNFFLRLGHLCGFVKNVSMDVLHLGEGQSAAIRHIGMHADRECLDGAHADNHHQHQDGRNDPLGETLIGHINPPFSHRLETSEVSRDM